MIKEKYEIRKGISMNFTFKNETDADKIPLINVCEDDILAYIINNTEDDPKYGKVNIIIFSNMDLILKHVITVGEAVDIAEQAQYLTETYLTVIPDTVDVFALNQVLHTEDSIRNMFTSGEKVMLLGEDEQVIRNLLQRFDSNKSINWS